MAWLPEYRVSLEDPNVPLGNATLLEVLGGRKTATGRNVNAATAITNSAVYAAVNVIASAVGSLPLKVWRGDGTTKTEARDHPLWTTLHDRPNPEMTASSYREAEQGHMLTRGTGFSEIVRSGGGDVELWPINPDKMKPVRVSGTLAWEFDSKTIIPNERILHVPGLGSDGITGWSVVSLARESIGLGLATEEYGARFFGNNSIPTGLLSHPETLSDGAAKRLKASWEATQGGLSNSHRVAVLEEGVEWKAMGLSAEDSQFLQTRQFQVREIARWFNVQPHKIGDLDDATFGNIEEQSIEFVTDTLMPWLTRWEQAMNAKLLTDQERASGLFVQFVVNGLLRGDVEKRGAWYNTRFQTGSITPNQIRRLENENPIEGGDVAYIGVNMIPLTEAANLSVDERSRLMLAEQGASDTQPYQPEARKQTRDHTQRVGLRDAFRSVFRSASDRMVRGEIRNVKRQHEKLSDTDFRSWLDDYYFNEHPEFMRGIYLPAFESFGKAVSSAAAAEIDGTPPDVDDFVGLYTDSFTARYSASSRGQLLQLEAEDVELRLAEWDEGREDKAPRAEAVTSGELITLGEAVAKLVFTTAGFRVVWRLVGDSCPYCRGLSGRTVGGGENFLSQGDSFEPDDADVPLVPKRNVGHPPAHRGCNCTVAPA